MFDSMLLTLTLGSAAVFGQESSPPPSATQSGATASPAAPESPDASTSVAPLVPSEEAGAPPSAQPSSPGVATSTATPLAPSQEAGAPPSAQPSNPDTPVRPAPLAPSSNATASGLGVHRESYAAVERDIRYRIEAIADVGTQTIFQSAYRAFDNEDRSMFVFAVGGRADFALARGRVFVGGGAVYRQGTSSGDLGGFADSEVLIREPLLFVRCSLRLIEGLDVYVEPGAGPSIVDLRLESNVSSNQRNVVGMFNGVGGVTAYLPRAWLPRRNASHVTAGLDLGIGYLYRAPIEVVPEIDREDGDIDLAAAEFGELPLSGLVWRGGLFVRFM